MRSTLHIFILLLGCAAAAPAQQTPNAARVEACLRVLQCESAPKLATVAHETAEEGLKPVALKIAELAKIPVPTIETGLEREYVFRAFADALFMCEVAVDSATLTALHAEGAPLRMVLALASLDPKLAEDWLMGQLDRIPDFESWSVAVGLLLRAKSAAFAEIALARVNFEVSVTIKGPKLESGLGGYSSGRMRAGRKETRPPEGFPRLVDYTFTPIKREGDFDLRLEGPFQDFVHRGPLGKGIVAEAKAKGNWRQPIAIRSALELLSGVEMRNEIRGEMGLTFPEDVLPEAVDNRVYQARKALAAWHWEVVAKLVEREILPARQARRLKPKFPVKVEDGRSPGAKRLPKLDKALPRPDWVGKLK